MQAAVPLYTWPAPVPDAWEVVLDMAPAVGFVIFNPDSGPSTQPIETFQTAVKACQKAGISVLGYTPSSYAAREAKEVLADLEKYLTWYGVDGLFVDEVTCSKFQSSMGFLAVIQPSNPAQTFTLWTLIAGTESLEYYQQLSISIRQVLPSSERSRSRPSLVYNPGTSVIEEYMPLADILVTFEGPAAAYTEFSPSKYVWRYPAHKFWHIIHDVPPPESDRVLSQLRQNHVSWLYLTNLSLPNPYNALPEAEMWSSQTKGNPSLFIG